VAREGQEASAASLRAELREMGELAPVTAQLQAAEAALRSRLDAAHTAHGMRKRGWQREREQSDSMIPLTHIGISRTPLSDSADTQPESTHGSHPLCVRCRCASG
jgi:hypothetical protein